MISKAAYKIMNFVGSAEAGRKALWPASSRAVSRTNTCFPEVIARVLVAYKMFEQLRRKIPRQNRRERQHTRLVNHQCEFVPAVKLHSAVLLRRRARRRIFSYYEVFSGDAEQFRGPRLGVPGPPAFQD